MIDIGIVGLGKMGKNHVRVCSEIPEINLVGVYDIDKSITKMIAERFNTKAFISYNNLLKNVEAVIIATPTSTHPDFIYKAIDYNRPILVEKPMCKRIEDAKQIVKRVELENLVLSVGHIERHNPVVLFAKKHITNIINLNSKRVSAFPDRIKDVGVILDFGIHDIDVMRYLAGEVKSVYSKGGNHNKKTNFEDYANIILNFEKDVTGVIEINWLTPIQIRKLFLTCSNQFIEIDYINQSVAMSTSKFNEINEMDLYHTPIQFTTNYINLEKKEPLKNEIQDFVQAIKTNKKPLASGYDGVMSLCVAQAALRSFRTGDVINI